MLKEIFSRTDRLTPAELDGMNEALKPMTPEERLATSLAIFGPENIVTTFVNTDLLPKLAAGVYQNLGIMEPVHVLVVNTFLYEEPTLKFIASVAKRGPEEGYVVDMVNPDMTIAELTQEYPHWREEGSEDYEMARNILKVWPLNNILKTKRLWISGARRVDQESRKDMPIFDQREDGLFVFHPIVDWDDENVEEYSQTHNVHVNFLRYDFFKGTKPKQDQECGIHLSQG